MKFAKGSTTACKLTKYAHIAENAARIIELTNFGMANSTVKPYQIKKSRDKMLEIIKRGCNEERPIFSVDTEINHFPSNAKNVVPIEGFYDVATHGSPTFVEFFGEKIDAYTLSYIIRNRSDYKLGTKIRLLSCSTGDITETGNCVGQLLANELGVIVIAPTDILYVNYNGELKIGKSNDGEFKPFYPRK